MASLQLYAIIILQYPFCIDLAQGGYGCSGIMDTINATDVHGLTAKLPSEFYNKATQSWIALRLKNGLLVMMRAASTARSISEL
jgi:hypothetical protein